ncbi:hypothetical protein EBR96_06065, partial [bacterium]|nr:hypothetical protein [bacterium]
MSITGGPGSISAPRPDIQRTRSDRTIPRQPSIEDRTLRRSASDRMALLRRPDTGAAPQSVAASPPSAPASAGASAGTDVPRPSPETAIATLSSPAATTTPVARFELMRGLTDAAGEPPENLTTIAGHENFPQAVRTMISNTSSDIFETPSLDAIASPPNEGRGQEERSEALNRLGQLACSLIAVGRETGNVQMQSLGREILDTPIAGPGSRPITLMN